jgi:hypothetical protein
MNSNADAGVTWIFAGEQTLPIHARRLTEPLVLLVECAREFFEQLNLRNGRFERSPVFSLGPHFPGEIIEQELRLFAADICERTAARRPSVRAVLWLPACLRRRNHSTRRRVAGRIQQWKKAPPVGGS